eukprot:jgi/Undpi1/5275/HiC_scaffold_2.g00556.m1
MSNRNKRTPVGEGEPTFSQSCLSKWSKGMKQGAKWDKESFDEFPVCVHWFRQIAALLVGVAWGFYGIVGAQGLLGGFGLVMAITYVYYAGYIEADEMSFGDGGLKMEGLMPSLATFILAWTTVFTAMGHDLPGIA